VVVAVVIGVLVGGSIVIIFAAAGQSHTMVYSVTGAGSADISTNFADYPDRTLPWTHTESDSGFAEDRMLEVHSRSGATVTCTITVDGKVEDRQTGVGSVSCITSL